jgi:hypothetical protein
MSGLDYFVDLAVGLFVIQIVNFLFRGTSICQIPFSVHISCVPSHAISLSTAEVFK